jgi:hypothetical protein
MRSLTILGAFLIASPAFAACGSPARMVIDGGLHRQWVVVRDCEHPERPARLVEVPWSDAREDSRPVVKPTGSGPGATPDEGAPWVRPGMQVAVVGGSGDTAIHLQGVALEAGRGGETVLVRAGLRGAALRCIVCGPARVELLPDKVRN